MCCSVLDESMRITKNKCENTYIHTRINIFIPLSVHTRTYICAFADLYRMKCAREECYCVNIFTYTQINVCM